MFWRDWMLVILMEDQILATKQVCPSCLLADRRLRCAGAIRKLSAKQPEQYECLMGFRIANIE